MRDRKRYELACTYLVKVRALYEKLGEGEAWTSYVDSLARAEPQPACAERGTGERWLVRNAKG